MQRRTQWARSKVARAALGMSLITLVLVPTRSQTVEIALPKLEVRLADRSPIFLPKTWFKSYLDLLKQKPEEAFAMSAPDVEESSALKDELEIAAAIGLVQVDKPLTAGLILLAVAQRSVGTSQGLWALTELHRIAQSYEIDEDALEAFAYEFDGLVDPVHERSMLAWFRGRALMRRGYLEWANREFQNVHTDSVWHADRIFERSTERLADGRAEESEALLQEILRKGVLREPTRRFAELNRARLLFERGELSAVLETVRKLDLPTRERARVLLEIAWIRYYMRDYGRALGVLEVLRSPFYGLLKSPEADLLKMVIQRDLCRYDLVKESAQDFRREYGAVFQHIESRRPLDLNADLKQLALQARLLQKRAMLIHRYRVERRDLQDSRKFAFKFADQILEKMFYESLERERRLEGDLSLQIPVEAERVANRLLDFRNQVTYLEYEASIRPLRTDLTFGADYMPPVKSKTRFERLFWPITSEAWWDELEDYQVLLRGRCAEPLPVDVQESGDEGDEDVAE
jgi:hypothetical protein